MGKRKRFELKGYGYELLKAHQEKYAPVLGKRSCSSLGRAAVVIQTVSSDDDSMVSSDKEKSTVHGRSRQSAASRHHPPLVKRNRLNSKDSDEGEREDRQVERPKTQEVRVCMQLGTRKYPLKRTQANRPLIRPRSDSSDNDTPETSKQHRRDHSDNDRTSKLPARNRPAIGNRSDSSNSNRASTSMQHRRKDSDSGRPSTSRKDRRHRSSSSDSNKPSTSMQHRRKDSDNDRSRISKKHNGHRSYSSEEENSQEEKVRPPRRRCVEILNRSDLMNREEAAHKAEARKSEQKKKRKVNEMIYKAMKNISLDRVKWIKIDIESDEEDSDNEEIDREIAKDGNKPVEHWKQLAASMEKKGKDWLMDYIVATEAGLKPGDLNKQRSWVLIKWTGFAIPTWSKLSDINPRGKGSGKCADQVRLFMERMKVMARLEEKLRERWGAAFDRLYKHRWLEWEQLGEYVQNERSLYENKLMALEWRMNYEYGKLHKQKLRAGCRDAASPPLYVVNWSDDAPVPGVDFELKFSTKMVHSPMVATILANTKEMEWLACEECKPSCSMPREHFHTKSNCCGVAYATTNHYHNKLYQSRLEEPEAIVVDNKIHLGQLTTLEIESSVIVECTGKCACNGMAGEEGAPRNCQQMLVQRGRQVSLILMREDKDRGWGLRAGQDIIRGQFVTEYIGKVMTAKEAEECAGEHYMFQMRFGWAENLLKTDRVRNFNRDEQDDIIRRHKRFTVDASAVGNEARFINHSCEPNLLAVVVYVERHGEFYHRVGLFARRDIAFGEELTFDYFPSKDDIKAWRAMFPACRCGTSKCKFKAADVEEDSDEDDDDCFSVDSFISDNEEYLRQCEASRKRKREEREERLRDARERGEVDGEPRRRRQSETEYRAGDLRRDPFELMKDRCGGDEERARAEMAKRNERGILHLINKNPWSAEAHDEMIRQGREERANQRSGQAANKKDIKEEIDSEEDESPRRPEKGRKGRKKRY